MVYKYMTLHNITELYTLWFSACINITSKCRIIVMFRRFVKQSNDSN
jgi:hypothetical protein